MQANQNENNYDALYCFAGQANNFALFHSIGWPGNKHKEANDEEESRYRLGASLVGWSVIIQIRLLCLSLPLSP